MDPRREQFRRIRGAILKLLAQGYPATLDAKILFLQVRELGLDIAEHEFRGHLAYLSEKAFIEKEERSAGDIILRIVRITARGLDLLDGYTEDHGVEVKF